MKAAQAAAAEYNARIRRAEYLASAHPFAAEVLRFYSRLAARIAVGLLGTGRKRPTAWPLRGVCSARFHPANYRTLCFSNNRGSCFEHPARLSALRRAAAARRSAARRRWRQAADVVLVLF